MICVYRLDYKTKFEFKLGLHENDEFFNSAIKPHFYRFARYDIITREYKILISLTVSPLISNNVNTFL